MLGAGAVERSIGIDSISSNASAIDSSRPRAAAVNSPIGRLDNSLLGALDATGILGMVAVHAVELQNEGTAPCRTRPGPLGLCPSFTGLRRPRKGGIGADPRIAGSSGFPKLGDYQAVLQHSRRSERRLRRPTHYPTELRERVGAGPREGRFYGLRLRARGGPRIGWCRVPAPAGRRLSRSGRRARRCRGGRRSRRSHRAGLAPRSRSRSAQR